MPTTPLPSSMLRSAPKRTALLLAVLLWTGRTAAGPVVREPRLAVEIVPVVLGEPGAVSGRTLTLEAGPEPDEPLVVSIPWLPGGTARLAIRALGVPGPPDGDHALSLQTVLTPPGAPAVRADRTLTVAEQGSGLVEIYGDDERRVVLSVRVERVERPIVAKPPSGESLPVVFFLEIERRLGDARAPVESNRLATLVGEPVEYALRGGGTGDNEVLSVVLTPVRLLGEVAEIDVEISGTLPGDGQPLILSRKERVLTTRRASTSLDVVTGDPPRGFRFRITPDF